MSAGKKAIREKFRQDVLDRDGHRCKVCGLPESKGKLDAHHITDRNDMPNGGYVKENGICLCEERCHLMAEEFHLSGGTKWMPGFHPDDLYKLIGSSYQKAVAASERLK